MGKKIISFGLFGSIPKYTVGAVENAKISESIYPGWTCRFYVANDVPSDIISQLMDNGGEVVHMGKHDGVSGMFWRFLPCGDDDVDMMISRDTDSLLNVREKVAVDDWLASDKPFHIMRDHYFHVRPIMGGMWGAKKGILSDIKMLMDGWNRKNVWQDDQDFLEAIVWRRVANNHIAHDSTTGNLSGHCARMWPQHPELPSIVKHVGNIIDR